jgi:hypothetical protein
MWYVEHRHQDTNQGHMDGFNITLPWTYITWHEGTLLLIGLKSYIFWVELLFMIELAASHTVYLVWLHFKLDEQDLVLLSRDVVFENSQATRAPNADMPVIFLSLAFCRRQKVESQISFLRTSSLHTFSLKLCTCILFIWKLIDRVFIKENYTLGIHFQLLLVWVLRRRFETYISIIYKHNFNEYYSCEHMHKNK